MRVLFGAGSRNDALDALAELGAKRVAVITTEGREPVARTLGASDVIAIAEPQVPRRVVQRALDALDADAILSLGGGTATGLGKAVAFHRDVIFGAIPTTYAGSEMTDIWAMSEDGEKKTSRDARVRPVLVAYDPELTLGLPVDVSVVSGLNAMAHPVDASWNRPDAELLEDCRDAVGGWIATLPALAENPRDISLREDALRAAQRSGIALQRGTMGLQHKLAHVLGALGLPHAETHAVILPHVVAYNAAHDALSLEASHLFELMKQIGAPTKLAKAVDVEDVISKVMRDPYPNPEPMDAERLRELLERAAEGRAPK